MSPSTETERRGPLRPVEVASAAVLGGLCAAMVSAGWLIPHGSAIMVAGTIPMAVLGYRHRLRALIAACVAASALSFLVAGFGPVASVIGCSVVGGVVGTSKRREHPRVALAVSLALVGPLLAGLSVATLALLTSSRRLGLAQIRNTWRGITDLVARIPGLAHPARSANHWMDVALAHWWYTVAAGVIVFVVSAAILTWALLGEILDRLESVQATDRLDAVNDSPVSTEQPSPLPVKMAGVGFCYPDADSEALVGVKLEVGEGQLVGVVGPNGSGKSTLARVLAGIEPTTGQVLRRGGPGLGSHGGTSLIFQRPESQVLGVRVEDDIVWGLPGALDVDVTGLLAEVGLAGMEKRDTSTLSGGQLQRLAIAGALAREPRLLISDEATAMIDEQGRQDVMRLLYRLPRAHGMAVVHVTHRRREVEKADQVITLHRGSRSGPSEVGEPQSSADAATGGWNLPAASGRNGAVSSLRLIGVSHTYAPRTPWEQPALSDIDLDIEPGSGVLIVGDNGSGKSTLAWITAGLMRPRQGAVLLGDQPVVSQLGSVALAFQHSRLQVLKGRVEADIMAAGGVGVRDARSALVSVGLDPSQLAARRVDELSGGQLRRVALAGLLARRPKVLVLDEPLAGLDDPSRSALIETLRRLRFAGGMTLVVISHDVEGIDTICDDLVRLESGRISGPTGRAAERRRFGSDLGGKPEVPLAAGGAGET